MNQDAIFRAIADPTRREILRAVADEPQPVHAIAERFAISRPAVSKHLRVLGEAGLVSCRRDGKENLYALEREALRAAHGWFEGFWNTRLQTLKQLSERKT